jgi:hypothetical protein
MRVLVVVLMLSLPGVAAAAPAAAPQRATAAKVQKPKKIKTSKRSSVFTRGVFAFGKVLMPDAGY